MSFSSLRYLIREGFRSLWQNRLMAIASVIVLISCLLITGGAYLLYVNIERAFDWVYAQNVVVVFVKEGTSPWQLTDLEKNLLAIDNVRSITFLSKEESLAKMKDSLPKAVYENLQGSNNPLLDSYIVAFEDLALFDTTLQQIQALEHVDDVSYNGDLAKTLTRIQQAVFTIGGWVIGALLLVSIFIISNTIKLTVHNRRLEIYIMKSVGATNAFIRLPFVIEGIVIGLVSGALSFGIMWGLYSRLTESLQLGPMLALIHISNLWPVLLAGFLLCGLMTGALGSAVSLGRYLRHEGGMGDD